MLLDMDTGHEHDKPRICGYTKSEKPRIQMHREHNNKIILYIFICICKQLA